MRHKLPWALIPMLLSLPAAAEPPPGEGPNLRVRVSQEDIEAGLLDLQELGDLGRMIFTTPFNRIDGYGDGPLNLSDTVLPGGRPTLQGNGTFLRVNGLDAQTCLECHSVVSNLTIPATLGIGGVGGSNSNAIIQPTAVDPADTDLDGIAGFNGRFANPPFLFGAGGVELLGLEMTADLQALRQYAVEHPGVPVELVSKGVRFGTIEADLSGSLDTSAVVGVDEDLVVRPFGRKGEFATVREFDLEAVQFHLGMQPVELVGLDVDGDEDGVVNELSAGEISALHVFAVTLDRPRRNPNGDPGGRGFAVFEAIGCAGCHVPELVTDRIALPLRFPEVPAAPFENEYLSVDLTRKPTRFARWQGGLRVPLFADLKRHEMGPGLAESFARDLERQRWFTTARLWGVADTAPYLHDGRATTLTDAILWHGGEAQAARDAFEGLDATGRENLLTFLRSLRTPLAP